MTRDFYCRDLRDGYRIAKRKITREKIALCEICSRCPSYVVPVTMPGQRQAGGSVIHQGTGPGGRRPGRPAARAALAGLAGIVVLAAAGVAGAALTRHGLHDVAAAADAGSHPQVTSLTGTQSASLGVAAQAGQGGPAAGFWTQAGATRPGRDGRQARWVIAENKRRGTTAWRIRHPMGSIAGFANRSYARQGQRVTLYVTTAAATFRAEAFRMGYYQGTGARLVWQSGHIPGKVQPACPVTTAINMVTCDNWQRSVTFTVSAAFVQGDYLIKLAGSGGQQSYVPLTVWAPASPGTYVVQNDTLTWQAWNPWGGYDYYQGVGRCPAREYPLCSRARVVSFDRPYGAEEGSGNFLKLEYPLVRFAEKHGLDVTYATDVAIAQHPRFLLRHRVLLSLGHDECWSLARRTAALAARDRGMNIVFFGASPVLRHVRLRSSPLGPGREEVDYRDARADPLNGKVSPLLITGNTWGSPPTSWPENDFVGEMYAGFLEPGRRVSLVVADASSWVYRGTGLRNGSAVPGVIATDVDHFYAAMIHPANVQILAHSPIPLSMGQTELGAFYSDMTYYTAARSGAGVLDTGTTNWIPALARDRSGCGAASRSAGTHCASAVIQRITGNILRAFGGGPAGHRHPSAANWRQVTGQ
jgi:hypothetical protein